MLWTLLWETVGIMLDRWARHGMLASDFVLELLRPGMAMINAMISLPKSWQSFEDLEESLPDSRH
jgi:hypothetical protein